MRRTLIPTALIVATLALGGCSAGSMSYDSSGSTEGGAVEPMSGPVVGHSDQKLVQEENRQVIVTGYMTVATDDPADAATKAGSIVQAAGGRVESRTETAATKDYRGSATLTLRIPADALDKTIAELKGLGDTVEVSTTASDVTMQTQDLAARITALQASVDRLLTLLATATDAETLVTIETSLSQRQADLESLESQQRYLSDQVAMSTLSLNLVSTADAPSTTPNSFWSGLVAGWNAFLAFFAGLLVALGVLLPWIVFAGVVALVVILIVRSRRGKRGTAGTPQDQVLIQGHAPGAASGQGAGFSSHGPTAAVSGTDTTQGAPEQAGSEQAPGPDTRP